MKILVTGAKGFVGKNLVYNLKNQGFNEIYEYDLDTDPASLDSFTKDCNFVYHLAGINTSKDPEIFMKTNCGFTETLLQSLKKNNNKAPILFTSSAQVVVDNPYGRSKKAAEDLLLSYRAETGSKVIICRLPTLFGKWCKPNYNSIVATLCHNIAHDLPLNFGNPYVEINFAYIGDVIADFISFIQEEDNFTFEKKGQNYYFYYVQPVYSFHLCQIIEMLNNFKRDRLEFKVPDVSDPFLKKLYSTYITYLPKDQFNYPLSKREESHGYFAEFIKTPDKSQIGVKVIKPGKITTAHWHNTKCGKFLVVSGTGTIRFRRADQDETVEYLVSGENMEIVDIPPGFFHSLENTGETDLVTLIWFNEPVDIDGPDSIYSET
jgi:UDP-2-acetamido-2,6-beta-L-arabino-hexul-4-ose reductase